MRKTLLLLVATLLVLPMAFAQNRVSHQEDKNAKYREHSADIIKMVVEVNFEPKIGKVNGKVTHTFRPLRPTIDTLFFDAPNINISKATLNGKDVNYTTNAAGVTFKFEKALTWDEEYVLTIEYTATPRRGIYFVGWNDPANKSRKQIWTQGQGIDNRHWIPMYDSPNDKYITETIVTFDADYKVLSNGVKLSEKLNKKDNTIQWHYRMSHPHAGYLLMLGIGKYEVSTTTSKSGVVINNWYYPEEKNKVEPTYMFTAQMMDFLEAETGVKYPWAQYSQIPVQEFLYGAMENTTATIFGDFYFVDSRTFLDRNYIGVNCHEMTHQWFGDFVTARYPQGTWLQESFATYYAKLFMKTAFGEDMYQWSKIGEQKSALNASKNDLNPIRHTHAGTARVYPKGSFVIGMLRYVLGDEEYKKALNLYLTRHPYTNVETRDFEQAIQDALGIDMTWFFDQWIYRGGEPHYKVSYEQLNDFTEITVEQIHEVNDLVGYFKMPIVFEVYYTDGTKDSVIEWVDGPLTTVRIINPDKKKIGFVNFDPNNEVLKQVTFNRAPSELRTKALRAPNMLDKYEALVALREEGLPRKQDLLIRIYNESEFFALRQEAIQQMIDASPEDITTQAYLKAAMKDKSSEVRKTAIDGLQKLDDEWIALLEGALADSSYMVIQKALEKLCAYEYAHKAELEVVDSKLPEYKENILRYLKAVESVEGISMNVRISYYKIQIMYLDGKRTNPNTREFTPQDGLTSLLSESYEFRTRTSAMEALLECGVLDERACANLFNALVSPNRRLSGPAASTLNTFAKETLHRITIKKFFLAQNYGKDQLALIKASGIDLDRILQ